MSNSALNKFLSNVKEIVRAGHSPADNVEQIVPLMHDLLLGDQSFLRPEHFRAEAEHYARNAIYIDDEDLISLYALVWQPGQWTPVHDHGTWGVVGVHEGMLEERSFMFANKHPGAALQDIDLVKGSVVRLPQNSVTSFVPNPDHIHVSGNPSTDKRVVSLHLYGNAMAGFHIYDRENRSRQWNEVSHNES